MTVTYNADGLNSESAIPPNWITWKWVWAGTFYVTLIAAGIDAFPEADGNGQAWIVALAVIAAAWYAVGFRIGFNCWDQRHPAIASIYVAGTWVAWLLLSAREESFDIVAIGLYTQAFLVLPIRYAIAAVIALTGILLFRDLVIDGDSPGLWLFLSLAELPVIIGVALFVQSIARQSEQRGRLIRELETTRQELAEREREAGSLAERQSLAGEIHDTLAQGFATIVMHLEAAEAALDERPSDSRKNLSQARDIARENLTQARRLVWTLKPDLLAESSLPEAVARQAEQWSGRAGVPASVRVTGETRPLDPAIEVALYRALQEGLSNASKHAGARSVEITLSYLDELVALDIQDDGHGFSSENEKVEGSGFGLQNLRERVVNLGGSVSLESASEHGAILAVQIPLVGRLGFA